MISDSSVRSLPFLKDQISWGTLKHYHQTRQPYGISDLMKSNAALQPMLKQLPV
jgi:hypothetical protein